MFASREAVPVAESLFDDMPDQLDKTTKRKSAAKMPTGREERTRALRQAIIESAASEFAAQGYGGASLRSIASRTGIELGHLGYHFSTKMELWQAAVTHIFEAIPKASEIPLAEDEDEARSSIARMAMDYAAYTEAHPEHIHIVFSESAAGGERLDWLADHFLNDVVRGLRGHIERASKLGVLAATDASIVLAALVGVSAINFALPKLRDILLGGGVTLETLNNFLDTLSASSMTDEPPKSGD
ncbi:TetR/AcrR family transcriptional regulator [Zavarzinia compransoris]|uniref:TetR/AcrR family transcriptional regulator n=1 Tax=Zavarzinia marina TaxID=2911065 RepID=UPI001F2B26E1|nr:TetR/AcrR family transcriptional regulator [Zavarzinia marina]MCF4165099.1 TetR/AcrR family transcriptional regulator [Zavarzinia marina]